jgi:CheY-like chemotaxis protein
LVQGREGERTPLGLRLEELGYAVARVHNAQQALARLEVGEVDLVLLDATTPETDAYEVLAGCQADPHLRDTLVVAVADEVERIAGSLQRGAADYLAGSLEPALLRARIEGWLEHRRLREGEKAHLARIAAAEARAEDILNLLAPIGIALLVEKDFHRLLERILLEAKALCHSDGGTLYLRTVDERLQFAIMRSDSLHLALGGSTGQAIPYEPVPLRDPITGGPNHRHVAAYTALSGATVNIADAYNAEGFDFSGTRAFDRRTGYRSISLLTIPLKNGGGRVIGVIQLLNARDSATGRVVPFEAERQRVVEALAALAGAALQIHMREQNLREQIEQLRLEIDEARKAREVAEIMDAEAFERLRQRARARRARRGAPGG